jgi:hypothetical protein
MTILNKSEALVPWLAADSRPLRRSALRIGAGADLRTRVEHDPEKWVRFSEKIMLKQ